jgi:hypothetical protein
MLTVETLRKEIRMLQQTLATNGFEMRMEKRTNRILDLMTARMEIYKSIAHRQGLLIEVLTNEVNFERKVA